VVWANAACHLPWAAERLFEIRRLSINPDMNNALQEVCRASLPREALPVLAGLRARSGVEVTLDGERAWVSWPAGDEEVLRRVLPVSGAELYVLRAGHWHRFGRHLPTFGAGPENEPQALDRVLFPAPVQPVPPPGLELHPVALGLAPDSRPRRSAAALCGLEELVAWADTVPSARLTKLRAAHRDGRVLLLGERLPPLAAAERFWGEQVLVPLGCRPDPDLPESAIRAALGAEAEELLLLRAAASDRASALPQAASVEVIVRAALTPLTRAGLRLAVRGAGA
jgi:hypothetical protein